MSIKKKKKTLVLTPPPPELCVKYYSIIIRFLSKLYIHVHAIMFVEHRDIWIFFFLSNLCVTSGKMYVFDKVPYFLTAIFITNTDISTFK